MRVYKPTYTKLLPEGAKILTRKGNKYVRFKNREGRLTKSGDKVLLETAQWHISFADNLGISRELKGFTDRAATQRLADKVQQLLDYKANNAPLANDLQKWIEQTPTRIRNKLIGFGLLDVEQTAAGKRLSKLTAEFADFMRTKENTSLHVRSTEIQLNRIFDGCGFRFWSDISATKLMAYLKTLRDTGKRINYRTSNIYLKSAQHFCRWVVQCDYADKSPLRHVKGLNVEMDRRRERRAATPDELRRLIETTDNSIERFGMSGHERSLVYRFAAETGLRKNEIKTLKVSAFDFGKLIVVVETGYSKHRHKDVLPLRADLAAELQRFVANKMPEALVFNLNPRACDMIRADLADAKIPYKDDAGLYFDFHALRHTFITNLGDAPARVTQSLARHRSSAMTDRYTHIRLHSERAALDGLPDLTLPSEQQRAVKTGTDGDEKSLRISCFSDGQVRTNTDSNGKKTALNNQKTHSRTIDKGANANPSPKNYSGSQSRKHRQIHRLERNDTQSSAAVLTV